MTFMRFLGCENRCEICATFDVAADETTMLEVVDATVTTPQGVRNEG